MFGKTPVRVPQAIGFLLLPSFSMMAFTASIEPLRAANRMSGKSLYSWHSVSMDGHSVCASNGVAITADADVHAMRNFDVLFVCAGLRPQNHLNRSIAGVLRDFARRDVALGSVCTGAVALAYAGLLNGYRCTIHWENIEGFAETYPQLNITDTFFEIDRNRYTCSGGTAPLDMMIHSVRLDHGKELALKVADQMLHGIARNSYEHQRSFFQHHTGITHAKFLNVIHTMESNIEMPLPACALAQRAELSLRQIERLFKDHFRTTPAKYYLELRLARARQMVTQTTLTILQIAVSTGFNSSSHFSQAYARCYGHPPRADRHL